ncbi:MerR family transcriptional regulator [Corynebacterium sp. 22KM0430]|uniref:transcriptional regulator FtsR n=2 Tax=unclassified Corynebacterium TaxID=2624378 RepID=UPI0029C9D1F8|nr:MerR family transcriptional regulator [Corynebacterium sp. 22KM0430]
MSAVSKAAATPKPKKTMSIGVVLERLRQEFPDVTVSKIRFLESEGLVTPQRTSSGYRRFTDQDVERLRYILTTQRDNYLPLKVIREQLEAMDSGQVTAISHALVAPENFRTSPLRLTDVEVAQKAGVEASAVQECIAAKLISPDAAGLFSADDVTVVSNAEALRGFGFDERHLRSLRNAARRQADLIGQVAGPVAKSRSQSAKQQAEEMSQQMSALVVSLHASLFKKALRDELDL